MQTHRESDKFNLRMPEGWREALKIKAAKNRRSMNSEILAALESAVGVAAGESFADTAPAATSRTDARQGANSNHQG